MRGGRLRRSAAPEHPARRLDLDRRPHDRLDLGEAVERQRPVELRQRPLQHRVDAGAARHRLRIGLEAGRLQLALDEPAHRAARVLLQRAGAQHLALTQARGRGGAERGDRARLQARAGERLGAGALGGRRRLRQRPGHVRQRPVRLGQVGQDGAHVVDEERRQRGVAVLVGVARAQQQPPLGAGDGRVEERALLRERILARRQAEPGGHVQLAPQVVGQERLGPRRARELALLQAADDHRVEAASADRQRVGDQHRAAARRRAERDLQLGERRQQRRGREQLAGPPRLGGDQLAQLLDRSQQRRERARVGLLGGVELACEAAVRGDEQRPRLTRERAEQRGRAVGGGAAKAVELAQRPAARRLLPRRAGGVEVAQRPSAHGQLQLVGQLELSQPAGRAQVGEQIGRARLVGQQRAARQRQQAAAERGVRERHLPVERVRDPVGAEQLLDQRGRARWRAQHDRDLLAGDAVAQQSQQLRGDQLQLGALAAGDEQADGVAGRGLRRLRLEQAALERVQRHARRLVVPVVEGGQLLLFVGDLAQLLDDRAGAAAERLAAGLPRQRDEHLGAGDAADRLDRVELDPRQVVEAVEDHRRVAPGAGVGAQRVERVPGEQVGVVASGPLQRTGEAVVDRGDLVQRRRRLRQRADGGGEPLRRDQRPLQLGGEGAGGVQEAARAGDRRERLQRRLRDRVGDEPLALQRRHDPPRVAGPLGDLAREGVEGADAPAAPHRRRSRQLALVGDDVLGGRHDQPRVAPQPRAEGVQRPPGLGRVRGTCQQLQHRPSSVAGAVDGAATASATRPLRARPDRGGTGATRS